MRGVGNQFFLNDFYVGHVEDGIYRADYVVCLENFSMNHLFANITFFADIVRNNGHNPGPAYRNRDFAFDDAGLVLYEDRQGFVCVGRDGFAIIERIAKIE